jgi:hypothetical protein
MCERTLRLGGAGEWAFGQRYVAEQQHSPAHPIRTASIRLEASDDVGYKDSGKLGGFLGCHKDLSLPTVPQVKAILWIVDNRLYRVDTLPAVAVHRSPGTSVTTW